MDSLIRGTVHDLPQRIDVARHIAPANYALERERIWRTAWLMLGHTHDLPAKGSYKVHDIPTFGMSLLAVRGEDDQIRVFHNICRHRGNKLVRAGAGQRPVFTCNFHGWAFAADGRLRTITDEGEFEGVDKTTLGLIPVHTEIWNTFIFVNLAATPAMSLAQWLGEMHGQYDDYFEHHEKVAGYQTVVKCNWHLAVNSFTEGYHTLYLHKSTARDYQGGRTNPNRHRPQIEILDRHHRYSAPGNPDHVLAPAEEIAARYGRKMLPAFDFDSSMLPPGINSSRHDKWAFDVVEIFPNLVMLLGNHWHNELTYWPVDAEHTLVINHGWAYRTKNLGERISRSYFRARVRDVFREDMNTLEAQQAMLSSGAMREVVLSRQEMALRHHYKITDGIMHAA